MRQSEKEFSKKPEESILATARERFKLAEDAYQDIRLNALADLRFRAGEQWSDDVKQERSLENRPCLVINRIPQFIRQITNDQRQNRPSIKVFPVDDKADIETAKIFQGMIRHIEYNSGAESAYDTAFEGAAIKGFGFFRVITNYVDPLSFDQEILIKRIPNHFSVYLDPFSKEPDGSDASWCFIFDEMSKDDYIAEYGDSQLASMDDWESLGDVRPGWVTEKSCRVAEYFTKEYKSVEICLLSDGSVVEKEALLEQFPDGIPDGLIIDERKTRIPRIKWYKINAVEILEETEWPGRWIPVIPVYGDELFVDGKRILEGIVRHAKDAQKMLNYWASTEAEAIALTPRAPYIVAEGQIPKEYEYQWKTANRKSYAYLPYKPVSFQGQILPPPQRNSFEPAVAAITNARLQASEDLKATTGIYDAALGARSNETSGIAIRQRTIQAQISNFHLIDNLTRSIRHCGRILVDLIPKIYDTARAARIIGEEGDQEIIRINEAFERNGQTVLYNLSVGKYDVVVETGPSFATKRQEAAISMLEASKTNPQLMAVAGDLMIKNMDWPGAQEIAERIKKTLPPGLAEDKDQKPIPPEIKAQMDQMGQMIEALTNQLNEATETIKTKRIEIESKERIEMAKLQAEIEIQMAKLGSQESIELLRQEIAQIERRLNLLNQNVPIVQQEPQVINQNPQAVNQPAQLVNQEPAFAEQVPAFVNEPDSGAQSAEVPNEFNQQPLTGELPPGPPMGV